MLEGKIAIVTGGGQGIGKHAALTLARAGAKIAIFDYNTNTANTTAAEIDKISGAVAVTVDVRSEADFEAALKRVQKELGGADILVNNAGIVPHFRWGLPRWPKVEDMPEEFWSKVIQTNLYGTFFGTKHAIPLLKTRGGGHIINLYGGGGPNPPGALTYMITKNGIRTFSRYVAEEVRDDNICVVTFSPRYAIATEDASDEAKSRMPSPEVLEDAFVLASQLSMDFSGKCVAYDAGSLVIEDAMEG